MEGRLATELRGRKKERGRGGGELLIMDWFSHFFLGLVFLSPSRWMVIAPPALIMCWIGKKPGGKHFYGNWESIALEVDLLLLRFIPPITKTHTLRHTRTDLHARTHVRAKDRSTNYSDVWVKKRTKNEGGGGVRKNGGGEKVEQRGAGCQAPILASECQLWQETERRIIVSSRVWLPSLPLFSNEQSTFHHLYLI